MSCGVPFCQAGQMIMGMVSGCPLHNLIPDLTLENRHAVPSPVQHIRGSKPGRPGPDNRHLFSGAHFYWLCACIPLLVSILELAELIQNIML